MDTLGKIIEDYIQREIEKRTNKIGKDIAQLFENIKFTLVHDIKNKCYSMSETDYARMLSVMALIKERQEFLKQIEETDILTKCETDNQAREKLHRFIMQLKQFKEFDLARMQSYLKQFYVVEQNTKTCEIIGDMNALIRYIKEFLYGTK